MRNDITRREIRHKVEEGEAEAVALLRRDGSVRVGDESRHVHTKRRDHVRVESALAEIVAALLAVKRIQGMFFIFTHACLSVQQN